MSEFENYAQRIQTATIELESSVGSVSDFVPQLSTAVTDAQQAETNAAQSAQEAQDAIAAFNENNPITMSQYGVVEQHTTAVTIATQEDLKSHFGHILSTTASVNINVIPDADKAGWHLFVRNEGDADIGINSTVATAGGIVPPDVFALVVYSNNSFIVIPYTGGDTGGDTGSDFDWTTIPLSTTDTKGLMSSTDKTKLDTLQNYSVASTTEAGLMSSTDKTKLNGIEDGAEANVKADFNGTGDAEILNKPTAVYKGDTEFDPVTEEQEYVEGTGVQGYIEPSDAINLETLWTEYSDGNFAGVNEAPVDSELYARGNGSWKLIEDAKIVQGSYDPIEEEYEMIPQRGYLGATDKGNLDELWTEYSAGNFTGGTGGAGLSDAPSDGTQYVRKDGAWDALTVAGSEQGNYDPVTGTRPLVYYEGLMSAADKEVLDGVASAGTLVGEAPEDDGVYARKNGEWYKVPVASRGQSSMNPVTEQQEYRNPVTGLLSGDDYLKLYDLINS